MDAPLAQRLDTYAALHRERSPQVADAYQELVDSLLEGQAGANAPKPGDRLPPFLMPDDNGRLVALEGLLSSGPLVISFNRGSWCSFCGLELSALAEYYVAVKAQGGEIISITPETAAYSRQLRERLGLAFPILTDLDNAYALELGLAMANSERLRTLLSARGIDLSRAQNNEAWFVPIPATLLIDRNGIVRESYVNADFRQRHDPARLPGLLAAL